jgi:acetylornithine deacetylase
VRSCTRQIFYPSFHSGIEKVANIHPASQHLLAHSTNSHSIPSLENVIDASPLLSYHRSIVQIESTTKNEADVGDFIIRFLQARGFHVEKQLVLTSEAEGKGQNNKEYKERFNIYAYPASSQPPKVLLTSHIDTVPPFISYSLHAPTSVSSQPSFDRDNILISGRGSVDAKACVATQTFAVLEYLQTHPNAPLGLLFVVGEEKGGDGMKWFSNSTLNTSPPTFHTVIFGEPTDLALVSGHKGILGFKINSRGRAAHSGYPWLGRSAISALLPALSCIDQLGDIPTQEGGLPSSEKFGKTTLNIGHIEGGVAFNVVPAVAYAEVAVRLAAGTIGEAKEIIKNGVHNATGGNEYVTVEFIGDGAAYPPQDLDTDVEGFNITAVNYGTDVPNLHIYPGAEGSNHGKVKRYLYGPGSIFVAHGDHEGLRLWQLEEAVKGYKKLIDAAMERNKVTNYA